MAAAVISRRSRRARRPRARPRRRGRRASRAAARPWPGELVRPRGWPRLATGNGASASSLPSRSSSSISDDDIAIARRSSEPTGKPLRYHATCLRKSVTASRSAPHQCDQQLGVAAHDRGDLAEGGHDPLRAPGEGGGQVGEQPRPAQAAAADHDAVAAGLARPCAARRRPPRCRRCRAPARPAPA